MTLEGRAPFLLPPLNHWSVLFYETDTRAIVSCQIRYKAVTHLSESQRGKVNDEEGSVCVRMTRVGVGLGWTSVFVVLPFVVFGLLIILLEYSLVPFIYVAMTAFFCFGVGIPVAVSYVVAHLTETEKETDTDG